MSQSSQSAFAYANANRARFLDDLFAYLRIPSISAQPGHQDDVIRAARWLSDHLNGIGLTSSVEPSASGGNPIVYAEWLGNPGAPTVLIYGHYDVQPADPFELWTSAPFEPVIRDGVIYARGSDDNKGQHMAHIKALESFLKGPGALPVNVKFVAEGEEEIGGASLGDFVRANAARLACDCVMVSDGSLFAPDQPTITTGLRGLAQFELTVTAISRDVHSGHYGGNLQNPAIALGQILAQLKDAQGRVLVPGFYDSVRVLSHNERASIAEVPWGEADIVRETGALMAFGDPEFTPNERKGARPTLEVNGMWSGYTGHGSKTIIPATAHCKFTCRLVPAMDPQRTLHQVTSYIKQIAPAGVALSFEGMRGTPASHFESSGLHVRAAARAAQETYGKAPYYELEGGSIPVAGDFDKVLKKPVILLGFGLPDDAIHSPNEHYAVACYEKGVDASIRFLSALADVR